MLKFFFFGLAIGLADLVPGVSGGTVAFILGVYERLLTVVSRFKPSLLFLLKRKGWRFVASHIDIYFLFPLLLGALSSIFLFAGAIKFLIHNHALLLSGFFFGLLLASAFIVADRYKCFDYIQLFFVLIFCFIAVFISLQSAVFIDKNLWSLFFVGGLSICATALPGISGGFVLLLFGFYYDTLNAVLNFDFTYLAVLASGALCSIVIFSNFLIKILNNYSYFLYPSLLGLMLGGLFKLWPWFVKNNGSTTLLSPFSYQEYVGSDPRSAAVIFAFVFGVMLIVAVDRGLKK